MGHAAVDNRRINCGNDNLFLLPYLLLHFLFHLLQTFPQYLLSCFYYTFLSSPSSFVLISFTICSANFFIRIFFHLLLCNTETPSMIVFTFNCSLFSSFLLLPSSPLPLSPTCFSSSPPPPPPVGVAVVVEGRVGRAQAGVAGAPG